MGVKIGLLSDTHGDLDDRIFDYFSECDEVWHAGDIGSQEVLDKLSGFKKLRIVYGNIDDTSIRKQTDEVLRFTLEGVDVLITHIAGKPGKYAKQAYEILTNEKPPRLFVCGHSHILLVKMDKNFDMLWVNPGACGYKGFHKFRTLLRFTLEEGSIKNMEVIELGKR